MMKKQPHILLALGVFLFICCSTALAQNPERTKTIQIKADSAYTKIVQTLQESGYYIAKLDRSSGFIQTEIYIKDRSFFGFKEGEKRILNFLVIPLGEQTAKIVLNIFLTERYRGGSSDFRSYYEEEKGIMQDNTVYQQMWNKMLPMLQ